jgi:hypothetical protein
MPEAHAKSALLSALSFSPDFSGLAKLPALGRDDGNALLQWLDRSGLSLYLLRQLQNFDRISQLPAPWSSALDERFRSNVERTHDMLDEFERLHQAFRARGVKAIGLKGLTLTPDFCEHLPLRHQADIDFLVAPPDVPKAAIVLSALGYAAKNLNAAGETCFTTAMDRIPSTADYLYALQHQRQVDLHTDVWEENPWLEMDVPRDCIRYATRRSVRDIEFWSLSLEDSFLFQVLHVFRHSLRSWIRLSWLRELGRCIELHREDPELWGRITRRAGESALIKKVFAFVLGLVDRIFKAPLPGEIGEWIAGTDTMVLDTWLDQIGVDWAMTDWPGSLTNLFVMSEFIPHAQVRSRYWRSRLIPRKENASIGANLPKNGTALIKLEVARAKYLAQRASAHLMEICELPAVGIRWKRALAAARQAPFKPTLEGG